MNDNKDTSKLIEENKTKITKTKLIVIVIALVGLLGLGAYIKDVAFTGSSINSSDLVQESESGVSFKRPKQWKKVESSDPSIKAAFTEGGRTLDNSDQGILISTDSLGLKYGDLSVAQKNSISESFKEQFSDPKVLENESCTEVGNVNVEEVSQGGYDTVFRIKAVCEKLANRAVKATFKMLIGIKNDNIHIVGVLAINETWDKSGATLDEMLASVQPAN